MRLTEFIDESLRRFGGKETSRRSREMANQCRRFLEAYAEYSGITPEVIDLINPDFVQGFCVWLYERNLTDTEASIIDNWVETFWRIGRSAIRLGYIPKIDLVRGVREELAKKYKAKTCVKKGRGPYDLKSVDFKAEYQKVVQAISVLYAKSNACLDSRAKSTLVYMCGLALGGLEFEDIMKVEFRAEKGEDDLTEIKLYIPRYDIAVDFDGLVMVIWKLYNDRQNARPESGELLFPELAPESATQFRNDVTSFCVQHRIELFRAKSVFCDFLSLALCHGKSRTHIIRMAQLRTATALDPLDLLALHKLMQLDMDPSALLQANWRILRVFSQKLKIETVMESIDRLANNSRTRGEQCQIKQFAPMEEVVSKRTGRMQRRKVPVFGYYIFIKSRLPEAEMIERSLPDVSFMRHVENRRLMVTLTNREILRLRMFFSDSREDNSEIDLVDIDQWRADHAASLDEGQRVRILHGPFAGYEGVVYQIKNLPDEGTTPDVQLTTNHSVVVVRITPMSNLSIVTLSASVDPLHLQLIP
ncbi:MAG: hypothetical protein LUC85_02770 [Bacteroidales bacterium]|nr:hypothetical protein [Bacteroidales bacterium]MCD8393741.1 hypothetical protein [Bacteroidales bacterium]